MKFEKLPFVILVIVATYLIYRLAGENVAVAFLAVVLLGMVYTKHAQINTFIRRVINNG